VVAVARAIRPAMHCSALCHLQQHQDRRVAHAVLQIRQMPFGDLSSGQPRPCGSCPRRARSKRTRSPKAHQERILGFPPDREVARSHR
jgi:hypothetical protein